MAIQIIQRSKRSNPNDDYAQALMQATDRIAEGYSEGQKAKEFKKKIADTKDEYFESTGNQLIGEDIDLWKVQMANDLSGKSNSNKVAGLRESNKKTNTFIAKERGLDLNEFTDDELETTPPATFDKVTKPEKPPTKTQASQPIDPKQLEIINKVTSEPGFDELTLPQKTKKLFMAGVSKENTNALTESYKNEEDLKKSQEKIERETIQAYHKESEKYDEKLQANAQIARDQVEHVKDIENSIESNNVSPISWSNIFKKFGPIGELAADALLNKDQATLQASIPSLLAGWKEVFGVRLSDADLKILEDKLPSIGKSKEANLAITRILKKYGEKTLLRSKIGREIKEKNNGLRPLGYQDMIEQRYEEMTEPVKIINPNTGRPIEIPAYKLSDALASGATLYKESVEEMENE